ncbi:carbonic anhydrase [Gynurincola endophyticus]|uniref:carbonic anhydrase n=1 Tax=Gynurincola endophyticus TaxID=2479004 RepID=UPI000F8E3F0C|nr:carbonic anhydrase [Gynurincola endophyticus]
MKAFEKLLLENKAWAFEKVDEDPDYFNRLAHLQTPEILWIGCSDSRVPANEITGTQPGEIFVHRNIANMVVPNDLNLLCVLEYAVIYLKVKHVIVVGHYACGGIKAALSDQSFGIIDQWIGGIKEVYHNHKTEIDALATLDEKANKLSEYNVAQQVLNVSKTDVIQRVWNDPTLTKPEIHGWVYDVQDGILKRVIDLSATREEKYTVL